jgi:TolB-like protein/tetratricopeptide (TPR) repeat protein
VAYISLTGSLFFALQGASEVTPRRNGNLRYLFEDYTLDTERRELHRGADAVSITPQVFDLLDYLIRNRERVVSKDDLISAVWNGRIVSDAALTTRLNAARNAIGDSGDEQRLIKTLPRKGFRFVGTVREAQNGLAAIALNRRLPVDDAEPLVLPDRPSIAVLPFQNMSGDPDQDYFADGMVDEITTALSRFKSLFVIARHSSFTYKGKALDIKQVGSELGVRYVLEGSVRKAAGQVRIIGQLIDAASGKHLWADRFEGDLSDIFALQDRMTESVVSAVAPKMLQTEIDLAARRPNNLSAYDLCLRAFPHLYSWTRGGSTEALRLASRALEIDPRYGFAATQAGSCHLINVNQGWTADPKSEIAEGLRLIRLALSIDGNDDVALSILGWATASFSDDYDTARKMGDRAVALNANSAFAWELRGFTYELAGQPEEAIRSFERAIRLSPFDPWLPRRFTGMGIALIGLGRFDEAVAAAKNALQTNQTYGPAYRCLAAALAHLGRDAEAGKTVAQHLEIEPHFRISEWVAHTGQWQAQMYIDGLRKAGLPE